MEKFLSQKTILKTYDISYSMLYTWKNSNAVEWRKKGNVVEYDVKSLEDKINSYFKKKRINKPIKKSEISSAVDIAIEAEVKPVKDTEDEWRPEFDPKLAIKPGMFVTTPYKTPAKLALEYANKELGTDFKNWDDFSQQDLSEKFVTKHQQYISWYWFLKFNKEREFTKQFEKKFKDKFILRRLDLLY